MPSKVKIDIEADGSDARREFEQMSQQVQGLQDTLTTFAGQAKMQLANFAADAAIQLGQKFASDVGDRILQVDAWGETIKRNFGDNQDIQQWAADLEGIFGQGSDSILNTVGKVAEKLDLDGKDPQDLGMIKGIGELAGAISLYAPEIDDVFTELSNFLATGEAGQLEDYFGDLGAAGETMAERLGAITLAAEPAFEALESGAYDTQIAMGELKAAYDNGVTAVAEWAAGAITKMREVDGFLKDELGIHTDQFFGLWTSTTSQAPLEFFDAFDERAELSAFNQVILQGKYREEFGTTADEAHKAIMSMHEAAALPFPEIQIAVDQSEVDAALAKIRLMQGWRGPGHPLGQSDPWSQQERDKVPLPDDNWEYRNVPDEVLGGAHGLVGDFGSGTPVMLHGREAVIPLEAHGAGMMGGNSYSITVNVPPTVDAARVGRSVVETIEAYERSNGAAWRN